MRHQTPVVVLVHAELATSVPQTVEDAFLNSYQGAALRLAAEPPRRLPYSPVVTACFTIELQTNTLTSAGDLNNSTSSDRQSSSFPPPKALQMILQRSLGILRHANSTSVD
ncbi:hypothetical protein [Tunturiibacter gelidiferens]|uniref:Uncharacterized protein n=1 Tax=Tunturiibacter gelidiferens TaxID=3069689 RepID=A0AAU7YW93_9BACT